jgi:hypothetical protein
VILPEGYLTDLADLEDAEEKDKFRLIYKFFTVEICILAFIFSFVIFGII